LPMTAGPAVRRLPGGLRDDIGGGGQLQHKGAGAPVAADRRPFATVAPSSSASATAVAHGARASAGPAAEKRGPESLRPTVAWSRDGGGYAAEEAAERGGAHPWQ